MKGDGHSSVALHVCSEDRQVEPHQRQLYRDVLGPCCRDRQRLQSEPDIAEQLNTVQTSTQHKRLAYLAYFALLLGWAMSSANVTSSVHCTTPIRPWHKIS